MNRILPALASLSITTSLFLFAVAGSTAQAQPSGGYQLTTVSATAAETIIANDTLWKCSGATCTAREATSRPAIVCAQAAKRIGKVESFTALGATFDADALAKCNIKAK
jgi:hypothetical protein